MADDHLQEWNEIIAASDAAKHREQAPPEERIAALEVEIADIKKIAVAFQERLEALEAAALKIKPELPPE